MSIQLKNISLAYGATELLNGVTTSFNSGALTALVGRNGSGKSTLLRSIAALKATSGGEILIQCQSLATLPAHQLARLVSFVSTERVRIDNLTCREVVALGRAPYTNWAGGLNEEDYAVVDGAMAQMGMAHFANKTMDKMSDGECQRIMVARALAQSTPIILLDEPTAFLDMPSRYALVALLRRIAHESGKTIIFSTHELDIALTLCDFVALINNERVDNLPASEMAKSGLIEPLFSGEGVEFNALNGSVKVIK